MCGTPRKHQTMSGPSNCQVSQTLSLPMPKAKRELKLPRISKCDGLVEPLHNSTADLSWPPASPLFLQRMPTFAPIAGEPAKDCPQRDIMCPCDNAHGFASLYRLDRVLSFLIQSSSAFSIYPHTLTRLNTIWEHFRNDE